MRQTLNLFDYLRAIWKRRLACAGIMIGVISAAIGVSYFLPEVYRVEAAIMPVSSSGGTGGGGLGSILGNIPFLSGGGAVGGSNELVIYLQSKALQERVVKALHLTERFFPQGVGGLTEQQLLDNACRQLAGMVDVHKDRVYVEKIILEVKSTDPKLAELIARQYLVELQNFISINALTQAKRFRLFLEGQLAKTKEELLKIGQELSSFYGQNPVSESRAKLNVPVAVYANREQIRSFKDYEEFRHHFDVLQSKEISGMGNKEIRYVKDVPHQVYLKYLTTQQQILENNVFFLSQSLESAKLDEAKQEPSFQILDEPVLPKYKFKPQRRLIAQGALGASFFIALLYAFFREFRGKDPQRIEEEKVEYGLSAAS